jgi:peptidyl-tRNA hydrolase, PTH1 family
MILIAGLGNPGPRYAANRHNIGFMAAEAIARRHGLGAWRRRFQGETVDGIIGGERAVVLKPMTYMNESGRSLGEAMRFYGLSPDEVVVLHDELDLPPGKLRIKTGGGHAGHNGLRDIHAQLGSPDYWRLRIGIGHPGNRNEVANWVLKKPSPDDRIAIAQTLDRSLKALPLLIAGDMDKATALIHTSKPPRPKPPRPAPADAPQAPLAGGEAAVPDASAAADKG